MLTGGTAVRLDGADKASLELAGCTLLETALAALAEVPDVVVVGDELPTSRPVTFRREDPPRGGPVAGLLAGLTGFARLPGAVAVLAVDMPLVRPDTFRRLAAARGEADAAVLTSGDGRRQPLCGVYDATALRSAADRAGEPSGHGLSMTLVLDGLDFVEVPTVGGEDQDVDSWEDLRRLRER